MRTAAGPLAACALLGCAWTTAAPERVPYQPDRRDYAVFRAAYPEVLEPNYLPFMVHRVAEDDARGDSLIFCRWPDAAMPLRVWVGAPEIPDSLQDEFDPRDPAVFVQAVERALSTWERELEGLVRFRMVAKPSQAQIAVRLIGEPAPIPEADVKVLGVTRLRDACVADGWFPDSERMHVRFEVKELQVFVADEFGLLSDDQTEWIALHEIGHALGMRGHSPIPADLMYEVVRDRVTVAGLSDEDVNSFVSLYRLPNGAVFGRAPLHPSPRPDPPPPSGPPMLALAPHVDPRLGFSVRLPRRWLGLETRYGLVAVDGVTWDYTASFQIVVERFATIEDYLERYGGSYRRRARVLHTEWQVVNGRRALKALLMSRNAEVSEEVTLIESGDGRVIVVMADCPTADLEAYRPWFEASVSTLELWDR